MSVIILGKLHAQTMRCTQEKAKIAAIGDCAVFGPPGLCYPVFDPEFRRLK